MNLTKPTTIELISQALAEAIRQGEVGHDYRDYMKFCAEYLGTYMAPERDYLRLEELDIDSVAVGMVMGMACQEVLRGEK